MHHTVTKNKKCNIQPDRGKFLLAAIFRKRNHFLHFLSNFRTLADVANCGLLLLALKMWSRFFFSQISCLHQSFREQSKELKNRSVFEVVLIIFLGINKVALYSYADLSFVSVSLF